MVKVSLRPSSIQDMEKIGFSSGLVSGDTIYVAGQTATDLDGKLVGDDFETQLRYIFQKIDTILKEANSGLKDLVSLTVYVRDMRDLEPYRKIRKELLSPPYPVSTVVQVSGIGGSSKVFVEVTAIASRA
jgi:enamine deaminase RidA (YjgF/YER057c/UK114 family)